MRLPRRPVFCGLLLSLLAAAARAESPAAAQPAAAQPAAKHDAALEYDRVIRPILSNNCYKCHGPDAAERQGELRLDLRETATVAAESGKIAIVPGRADQSELVRRIFSNEPDEQMPPPDSGKKLTAAERQFLEQWVAAGADFTQHWSFVAPRKPTLPPAADNWARNPIDRFVLAKLAAKGLAPAPEADKPTLVRRLSLDLTGLPPTLAEVDVFLADDSPAAYDKLVDRLLSSPHYGERMALDWLDAARFADTHGYHIDNGRDMSRWREWVIDAFNGNMPFDRFTVEQLAGDLLPDATLEQKIASGFNRNHMINFEGGAIPEEYHTAYIVDRVNTTATVWMGLTVACTQCHDHKYDPLTQKDYYQLFAFFHNVPENGLDGQKGNAAPMVKSPTSAQQRELAATTAAIAQLEQQLAAPMPEVEAAQVQWEPGAAAESRTEWITLEPSQMMSAGGASLVRLDDGSIVASGANPANETYTIIAAGNLPQITAIRLEALPDDALPSKGPGRSPNGNAVLTEFRLSAAPALDAAAARPIKIKAASADFSQASFPVANAIDGKAGTGWAIHPEVGKPHEALFELETPLAAGDGLLLTVALEFQSQHNQHQFGKVRLSATRSGDPRSVQKLPQNIADILALPAAQRTAEQAVELRKYYRENISPPVRQLTSDLVKVREAHTALENRLSSTMVMQEMTTPRDTFVLVRGEYDKHGAKVTAGVPASLPPLAAGAPPNRLGLARWLVDPAHPLTARVIVNRYWQMYFGTGIVKTSEDFGSQGEYPTHPELLDWLATQFVESGWDIKALQRMIVTSAAYRQQSHASKELLARDPENRYLARGARMRLPAEFIRDQALAVSGLLNPAIGGASVSPYQPPGLWEELMSRADGANWTAQTYVQSHGPDLYRRGMYTFWKRTSPPATLGTFDAPDRETCTVRRARTNTPLQALVLLNDPTYVEASRKLAERMMVEAGPEPAARIKLAFRLSTAREPSAQELAVLRSLFDKQLAAFRQNDEAAGKLLAVGESPVNAALDRGELAAWAIVASVILNLDETVTKG
jgi:hypothetical protein